LQARAELDFPHAFVLTATQTKKVWQMLEDAVGAVRATASCADHLERTFTSAENLVDYENPRARQILRLEFSARSSDYQREAYLGFGGSFRPITVRVTGCEPLVSRVKDTLADIVAGMRPWYSAIARLDIYRTMALLSLIWTVIYSPIGWISLINDVREGRRPGLTEIARWRVIIISVLIVLAMVGLLMLLWGLCWLQQRFFPVVMFALGQGQARYDVDDKWRWGVLFAFAVSTLGSIVAGLMFLLAGIGGSP